MKKIINICLFLTMCLCCIFAFARSTKAVVSDSEELSLKNLLTKYYDDGYYQKDTVINLNESAMSEAKKYFHVETYLERTTLFDGNELYMTNESGSINSGYGTNENGDMTHFTKNSSGLKVVDYTVEMPNAGGMEEYYNTLKDLLELDYSEWSYSNGVYTYEPENPVNSDEWFTIFRDITAPCFLNSDDKSSNYILFSKITIEEKYNRLLLKLYVDENDYAKLTEEHQTDLCFSQATIVGGHLVDLGTVGNEGANGYYRIYAIRTKTSVVIEALTYVPLTSSGLDKLEIFMSVDKFYGVGGSGARNSEFVLFNIFSSGLIRGWNWPNNVKSKDNVLFKFGNNKVTSNGVNITNTVTISETGLNKFYFEVPYAFFQNLNTQEKGLDGVTGNTVVNKSTPIGFYILSGYKVGGTSGTWATYDSWSYKVANNSHKNYSYDLPILTHENTITNNYSTYMNGVLSSFESLSNYVEAVYGKGLEGNMATFSGQTTRTYAAGSPLFSDRASSLHGVPADGGVGALNGLTFIYDSVAGNTPITATKSGYLLMALDDNTIKDKLNSNWDFISKSYLPNLGVNVGNRSASLYIIWLEEGQTVTVPANALVFTK